MDAGEVASAEDFLKQNACCRTQQALKDRVDYLSKKVGSAQYMISSTLLVLWPPEHWV